MRKWLLMGLAVETLCVTYALSLPSIIPFATILYVFSGLLISFSIVKFPCDKPGISWIPPNRVVLLYQSGALLLTAMVVYWCTRYWIAGTPLSYKDADMLPIMEVMARRFTAGDWSLVYQPIPEIWNGIQPIYLPAMWLPFTLTLKAGIDPRWLTSCCAFMSVAVVIFFWGRQFSKISGVIIWLLTAVLTWWLYTDNSHNFIRLSEEGVVVFYYSMLTVALLSGNFLWIGVTAALCAFSRFTLAGWFPVMILYLLLVRKKPRDTLRFVAALSAVALLLVIIPFGWKPLQLAINLPGAYQEHAVRVWRDNPGYFYQSMGLAKFFGPGNIALQHTLLLLASFLLPLLCMVYCIIRQKIHRVTYYNLPLGLLKLALVVTYALIDVPYQYLFFTSSFVSLIAVSVLCGNVQAGKFRPVNAGK